MSTKSSGGQQPSFLNWIPIDDLEEFKALPIGELGYIADYPYPVIAGSAMVVTHCRNCDKGSGWLCQFAVPEAIWTFTQFQRLADQLADQHRKDLSKKRVCNCGQTAYETKVLAQVGFPESTEFLIQRLEVRPEGTSRSFFRHDGDGQRQPKELPGLVDETAVRDAFGRVFSVRGLWQDLIRRSRLDGTSQAETAIAAPGCVISLFTPADAPEIEVEEKLFLLRKGLNQWIERTLNPYHAGPSLELPDQVSAVLDEYAKMLGLTEQSDPAQLRGRIEQVADQLYQTIEERLRSGNADPSSRTSHVMPLVEQVQAVVKEHFSGNYPPAILPMRPSPSEEMTLIGIYRDFLDEPLQKRLAEMVPMVIVDPRVLYSYIERAAGKHGLELRPVKTLIDHEFHIKEAPESSDALDSPDAYSLGADDIWYGLESNRALLEIAWHGRTPAEQARLVVLSAKRALDDMRKLADQLRSETLPDGYSFQFAVEPSEGSTFAYLTEKEQPAPGPRGAINLASLARKQGGDPKAVRAQIRLLTGMVRREAARPDDPESKGVPTTCYCGSKAVAGYALKPRGWFSRQDDHPVIAQSFASVDLICTMECPEHSFPATLKWCEAHEVDEDVLRARCAEDYVNQVLRVYCQVVDSRLPEFCVAFWGHNAALLAAKPDLLAGAGRAFRLRMPDNVRVFAPSSGFCIVGHRDLPTSKLGEYAQLLIARHERRGNTLGESYPEGVYSQFSLPKTTAGYFQDAPRRDQRPTKSLR